MCKPRVTSNAHNGAVRFGFMLDRAGLAAGCCPQHMHKYNSTIRGRHMVINFVFPFVQTVHYIEF